MTFDYIRRLKPKLKPKPPIPMQTIPVAVVPREFYSKLLLNYMQDLLRRLSSAETFEAAKTEAIAFNSENDHVILEWREVPDSSK